MNPLKAERIETKRLVLRPFRMDDAQAMFDNWASDPEVTRFLTWPTHESVEVTRQVIGMWIESESADFCIALKETDEPLGSIGAYNREGDTIEVGYCLSRKSWGKGYASEALKALNDWLFANGISRITAKHDLENPNSGRVMEKAGMKFLEIRLNGVVSNLGQRDVAVRYIDNPNNA